MKTARRKILAEKIAAGDKISAIAEDCGISREHASREIREPETQALIAEMMDSRRVLALSLLDESLKVIRDSYKAKRFVVVDKTLKDLGADHFARLAGVQRYTALMLAGRIVKAEEKKQTHGPITIQAIEAAILAHRAAL